MPKTKTKTTDGANDKKIVSSLKRLSLNLSDDVYSELTLLAKARRSSMTEIVRLAFGLVKIAVLEAKKGNGLVVTTNDGHPVKEIVLP